jgi:hypothetical protein
MKRAHTKTNSAGKRLKIGDETRGLYEKRDRSLDHDPDAPVLSPEVWQNAAIGKYYRPLKTPVSLRIDNDGACLAEIVRPSVSTSVSPIELA